MSAIPPLIAWSRSSAAAIALSCIGVLTAAIDSRSADPVILDCELRSRAAQRGRDCLYSRLLQSARQLQFGLKIYW